MASRVVTRPAPTSTTTTTTSTRQAYANGATGHYPSRRAAAPPPVKYTVEQVRDKHGREQEVLTLEDTPEPGSAPSAMASYHATGGQPHAAAAAQPYASTSQARLDPYNGYEPAPKKRRSDAAATGAGGAAYGSGTNHYADATYAGGAAAATTTTTAYRRKDAQAAANGSGQKRKHDEYARDDAYRTSGKGKEKEQRFADAEGHFIVRLGDVVTDRRHGMEYRIEKLLGQGTFGKVVAAKTIRSGDPSIAQVGASVAVKIIRNVQKYQEAAKTEIRVLQKLRARDTSRTMNCIRLNANFDYYGHTCLVTDLLSVSVFDFLKDNSYEPFPLSHVQQFAKQLLTSLQFVHQCGLIHTDLKPENILLMDNSSTVVPSSKSKTRKLLNDTSICLIDFGSATFEDEYHASVVSTRHYRAPEIILCLGWSYPCDLWSIGCILVEFITGEALFQTHENLEHLAMMQKVFGPMPQELITAAERKLHKEHSDWFKSTQPRGSKAAPQPKLNFPNPTTQKQSKKYVAGMKTLRDIIRTTDPARERFYDLCKGLLRWEKSERLTVSEALEHDFFKTRIVDEGTTYRQA
ncbi:hypothetical protein JCM10212_003709 [Sporobolomyces blumeae]